MTKTPQHNSGDRLRIAEVSGALSNLSGKLRRDEMTLAECVAELHGITRDPHLLAHGLGDPDRYEPGGRVLLIAEAAGIDFDLARRLYLEMHPPGRRGMTLGRGEVA